MFSPPIKKVYNQLNNYQKPTKRNFKSEIPKIDYNYKSFDNEKLLITQEETSDYERVDIFGESRWNSPKRSADESSLVGNKARIQFLDSFRNLHRFSNNEKKASAIDKYLLKLKEKHLSPVPMGIVKNKGKNTEFNIAMYGMGDNYAEAFSESIGEIGVNKLNLNDNRLTQKGAKQILEKISADSLIEFDISNNKLKKNNFSQIQDIISTRQSILTVLRLEGLKMKDENCILLCKALKRSQCIIEVNFAKNDLEGSKSLAKFIIRTKTLQKLDLHWNNIRGDFAIAIAKAIGKNKTIKVLDLSWNALSSPSEKNCSKQLGASLKMNTELIHLDISHNSFTPNDIKSIGEGLEFNHTILGIHISGNFGTVDDLGFLSSSPSRRPGSAHRFKRILGISRVTPKLSWRPCSNCWLCECWSEVEFTWNYPGPDPIYLHLDFEDYEGDLMEKISENNYKITKMCPPGKFYYVFTLDGELNVNPKHLTQILPEYIEKDFQVYEGKNSTIKINEVNVKESNPKGRNLLDFTQKNSVLPRIPRKKFLKLENKKQWGIPVSIFKDYRFDNEELIGKCFEYDWSKCKVPKIVKDKTELQKIRKYLSDNYKTIKEIYKYYSSISPQGEIWSIGQMVFTDLCNEAQIVDGGFRLADIDFHMKGALYSEVRNPRSPPNALVRYQFMEILVRIAIDKYYKSGIVLSHSEAVIMLIENNILRYLSNILSDKWRFDRYINEDVDNILKSNKRLLKNIFGRFSAKKVKPGQKPFMCLAEFDSIVQGCELINENFTVREICLAFNLGMMTQVQELDGDRQYQMTFIEFLESFCRAADMAKIPDTITKEKPTETTHLSIILGNTIPKLINLLPLNMQKEYREKPKAE